ncbi:MAG TPA: LacI family DNA-binding transcriptional regulator [Jiangellales bacterium]|nr:LacI family DNA-binding transcriptional regulator [Jiangellales bacterium]
MINDDTPHAPTIMDVARRAGVSRAAVSKVLRDAKGVSPAMRERVNSAIDALDYRPRISARGMRGSTFTLGIEIPDFSNQFFSKVIDGATAALSGGPYQLIVAPADPAHAKGYRAIQALADRQADGVVAVSPMVDPEWLEDLATRLPLVMLGRHDASVNFDTVVGDDAVGARLAVEHLLDLGHRDIAHLTLHDPIVQCHPGTPHGIRLATYKSVMDEAGLGDRIRVIRSDPGQDAAYRAMRPLLASSDRPTAVFAAHDEPALGVLRALTEAGLTPQDVSLVGYDDSDIAGHPRMSLTSVNQSGSRMGERTVRLLLERIAGRTDVVHEVIAPRLVVRGSSVARSNR